MLGMLTMYGTGESSYLYVVLEGPQFSSSEICNSDVKIVNSTRAQATTVQRK